MAIVTVNGLGLNVEVSGQGAPLLLLHGFTGSIAAWGGVRDALAERTRVIAVDLIGHGASDAPRDAGRYAMARCAADLVELLDALELEAAMVLGYSLGARVALRLAVEAPARVRALILESGSPGLAELVVGAARRAADERLADDIERDGLTAFVARWEALPLFASQAALPAAVREGQRTQRLRNRPLGLANSLRGMGTGAQEPLWARLGEVAAPTLLMAGELDAKFVAIGRSMQAAMPQARLEVVPGAGHAVHLERPDIFTRIVGAFIESCAVHAAQASAAS